MEELQEFRVPIEGLHTETGPGVYEAAILYAAGIESGDDKPKRGRATKTDAPGNEKAATKDDAGPETTDASETANGQQSTADPPAAALSG